MAIFGSLIDKIVDSIKGVGGASSGSSGSSTGTSSGGGGGTGYTAIGTHNDATAAQNDAAIKRQIEAQSRAYESSKAAGDKSGMDRAHAEAERLRAMLGYSGGVDGSDYLGLQKQQQPQQTGSAGFTYEDAPTYTSKYESQIDSMLNQILNRDQFSYDHMTDPLYQQYAQAYQREGQRSLQDTLGNVSAQTGGLASSYATTAAQQASDYYAAKQADIIPELYQLAYGMYLDDIDGQVRDLGLLNQMDDTQYGRYRDTMGDWRDDRNFAYDQYRDDIGDQRYQSEWDYMVGRDQIGDDRYADETAYNRYQDSLNWAYTQNADAYNRAMQTWSALGYLDEQSAQTLGLPVGTRTSDYQYQLAKQASSSGGGSDGGKKGGTGDDTGILAKMRSFGNDEQAYEYLVSLKKTAGVTDNLWNMYKDGNKEDGPSKAYDSALKYALANPGKAETYLNSLVNQGHLSEDEAAYIYVVELGNVAKAGNEAAAADSGGSIGGVMTKERFEQQRVFSPMLQQYASYEDYVAEMKNGKWSGGVR